MYVDVTDVVFSGNVHLYIGLLNNEIPDELRNRVYCMHLSNDNCIKHAEALGFNVVHTKVKKKIR